MGMVHAVLLSGKKNLKAERLLSHRSAMELDLRRENLATRQALRPATRYFLVDGGIRSRQVQHRHSLFKVVSGNQRIKFMLQALLDAQAALLQQETATASESMAGFDAQAGHAGRRSLL
jgi:hypothetical protein